METLPHAVVQPNIIPALYNGHKVRPRCSDLGLRIAPPDHGCV